MSHSQGRPTAEASTSALGGASAPDPPPSDILPDPAFAIDCARFFAARLQGPAEAREAVLSALASGEPYPLAGVAWTAGPEAGLSRALSRRIGLLAEVIRAALRVCADAYEARALPSRLDRARRVLVADTLLTFCYELAADLPEPGGERVRALLPTVIGSRGFLADLVSGIPVERRAPRWSEPESGGEPERAAGASAFLEVALRELGASLEPETTRAIRAIA